MIHTAYIFAAVVACVGYENSTTRAAIASTQPIGMTTSTMNSVRRVCLRSSDLARWRYCSGVMGKPYHACRSNATQTGGYHNG